MDSNITPSHGAIPLKKHHLSQWSNPYIHITIIPSLHKTNQGNDSKLKQGRYEMGTTNGTDIKTNIPLWRKYTLTVQEAAKYFRIGDKKLKRLIDENPTAEYILWNGNRPQIKRKLFEQFLDEHLSSV